MTKGELKLKKEAEEYALKQWEGNLPWSVIQKSYFDGALPREKRIEELEAQIEKMKSDVKQLREDRMNDDTDQNIMDRLWEEWTVNFGVSN